MDIIGEKCLVFFFSHGTIFDDLSMESISLFCMCDSLCVAIQIIAMKFKLFHSCEY